MNKKMNYKVIQETTLEGLVKGVNRELKKGWKCQGGVAVLTNKFYDPPFYQAMVK